jgi:hypothetical protein
MKLRFTQIDEGADEVVVLSVQHLAQEREHSDA